VPNFTISQAFHCASCIFSAPTCAHSFLCASIPREFRCRNWGFFLTFSPIYHRHSATMKFIQFHPDNTNSTSATTNHCGLTFLERIYPKSIHELRILITKTRSNCHGFTVTSNSTNSRSEFARTDIKSIISHHMAEFLNFPMNLTTEIGAFPNSTSLLLNLPWTLCNSKFGHFEINPL
jgi:hypothetical protein